MSVPLSYCFAIPPPIIEQIKFVKRQGSAHLDHRPTYVGRSSINAAGSYMWVFG